MMSICFVCSTSTDFAAALELVLSTAIDNRLPQDQMPAVMFVVRETRVCEVVPC